MEAQSQQELLLQRQQEQQQEQEGAASTSGRDSPAAAAGRARPGGHGADTDVLMAAYKASKAVAAGLLSYEEAHGAFELQAALQPLKWRHFQRRAQHMARQVWACTAFLRPGMHVCRQCRM